MEKNAPTADNALGLAVSAEHIDLNYAVWTFGNTSKIVDGLTLEWPRAVVGFFHPVPTGLRQSIGLEGAASPKFSYELGVSSWDVREADVTMPNALDTLRSILRVGGRCMHLNCPGHRANEEFGESSRFVQLAQEINASMPEGSTIIPCCVTSSNDTRHLRESPGVSVVKGLTWRALTSRRSCGSFEGTGFSGTDLHRVVHTAAVPVAADPLAGLRDSNLIHEIPSRFETRRPTKRQGPVSTDRVG